MRQKLTLIRGVVVNFHHIFRKSIVDLINFFFNYRVYIYKIYIPFTSVCVYIPFSNDKK